MPKPWDLTSDQIAQWSQRYDAPGILPDLVRRLLLATSPISQISMSAHGGTRLPGWDGVVRCSKATAFCPDGLSVWELTVEDTARKLNEDFDKRRSGAPDMELRAATYVAVSARRLSTKTRWLAERRAERVFRDVRLLDAEDLAAWLAIAPAVSRWFASSLGHPAADAEDVEGFLAAWSRRTRPRLPIEIALAGEQRQRSAESVRAWARQADTASTPRRIHGETCEEAAVFAAAALASDRTPEGEQILARTIVVSSQEALSAAVRGQQAQPLIVLTSFRNAAADTGAVLLSMDGPLPDAGRAGSTFDILRLSPAPFRRFAEILTEASWPRDEAERVAAASGGSIGALQRVLGYVELPEWARSFDQGSLSALLLAGAFEVDNAEDRDALEILGVAPAEAEILCERLRVAPGSPVVREEGRGGRAAWTWRSPEDAWNALVGQIPADTLRRFEEAVRLVLGERDPKLDLPPEQRFAAALYGKTLRASSALREGLTKSLARIAWRDDALAPLHGAQRGSLLAKLAVRDLLPPSWSAWASLSDLLPVLAEAAPSTFLDCVEASLREQDGGVAHLLALETGWGSNPHTGLLWALETIGWDERLMPRVASALAKLAEHDAELERKATKEKKKQNRIVNRPAASLGGLLAIALPQTRASLEQRIAEIQRRLDETGDVAFSLLVGQINSLSGTTLLHGARKPQLWPMALEIPTHEQLVERTNRELSAAIVAYFDMLLAHAGTDPDRWATLLENTRMAEDLRIKVLDHLERVSPGIQDREGRLWAALRHVIHWLPAQNSASTLDRWKALYEAFRPGDPVLRYAWLFAPRAELPEPREKGNWEAAEAKRLQLRLSAVEEIGQREDRLQVWDAIAEKNQYTSVGHLGWTLGMSSLAKELDAELLGRQPPVHLMATIPSYLMARLRVEGADWTRERLARMVDQGRRDEVEKALQLFPAIPETWNLAGALGEDVKTAYWRDRHEVFGDLSPGDWHEAIRGFLDAGNVGGAVRSAAHAKGKLAAALAADALTALFADPDELRRFNEGEEASYLFEELRDHLEQQPDAESKFGSLLANMELILALSSYGQRGPTRRLSAAFAAAPQYFVDLVTQMYRRSDETSVELAPEETEKAASRAASAYGLLDAWKGYPGEGLPAPQRDLVLHTWCLTALRSLLAEGRSATGTAEVARVLARAPDAEDGHWPCVAARKLLESDEFPPLARALAIAQQNLRGVTTRSLGEGGRQERELSARFRRSATALRTSWPRTADMLDELAGWYEHDAIREDAEAARTLREEGAEPHDFGEPPSRRPASPKGRAHRPGLVHLDRLTITDFALFDRFDFEFKPRPEAAQWILLLGGNGRGKTTLLRALALALAGESVAQAAIGQLGAPLIRVGRASARCVATTRGETFSVQITNDGTGEIAACEPANGARPRVFGYGCRRGSALGGNDAIDVESPFSDVATLFSGAARLRPATGWLKDLKLRALQDPKHAHVLDLVVKRLCDPGEAASTKEQAALLPHVHRLDIVDSQVWAIAPKLGGRVPLAGLSDGYLTTLGWVIDLIAKWLQRAEAVGESTEGDFLARMEGLVLIDELDLHLHPSWQRTIVKTLKGIFPRLSFVATTHNPVTLLGAEPGEIVILGDATDGERAVEPKQIDLPPGIRPDRILTGDWFGLPYAVDDETMELIERHQRMLLEGVSQDAPERRSVEEDLARRYGSYADTSLDRMALEVAAELMRERRPRTPEERSELQRRLKERVKQRVAERDRKSDEKP
jgi:energy-coupling factor transporter ATP-binding protein EcfA2